MSRCRRTDGKIDRHQRFYPFQRGKLAWESLFPPDLEDLAISAITWSELWVGVHRTAVERRDKREQFVRSILNHVTVLEFDKLTAEVHARLAATLQMAGTRVGDHDLLIAATAIRHDLEVLSYDERSFPRVPGIKLVPIPKN